MRSERHVPLVKSHQIWHMPLVPESYDQSPLTEEEQWALECYAGCNSGNSRSKEAERARNLLVRFDRPLADVFHLRHQGRSEELIQALQRFMRREMYRRGKIFWVWSPEEWIETLQPTYEQFSVKFWGSTIRVAVMDAAYLLGGVTDLRSVGIGLNI